MTTISKSATAQKNNTPTFTEVKPERTNATAKPKGPNQDLCVCKTPTAPDRITKENGEVSGSSYQEVLNLINILII